MDVSDQALVDALAERRSVLGEGVDRRLVGDIHGPGVDLIALAAQLLCDGGEVGLVEVGEQQATTGGAAPTDGDADAAGADQNGDLPGHLRRGGRPCSRGGLKIRVSGCGHPSTVAAAAAPEKTGSFQGTAVPPRPGPGSMAPCASVGSTMMRDMPPRTTSRQSALSTFLRTRRDRLSPAEVGLTPGVGLRRTPGLRREELAALAGISVDYYIRLERGSESRPSAAVVDALARALKLDEHERRHLHDLAAHSQGDRDDRAAKLATGAVSDGISRILTALRPLPAFVTNPLGDLLAWNPSGLGLLPGIQDWADDERDITARVRLPPRRRPRSSTSTGSSRWLVWSPPCAVSPRRSR